MCYLARTSGSEQAHIEWQFDLIDQLLTNSQKKLSKLELRCDFNCFESGEIKLKLFTVLNSGDENCLVLEKSKENSTKDLDCAYDNNEFVLNFKNQNVKSLRLRAEMCKGNGENAWQHTQLFRQSLNDTESYLFIARFHFE